MCFIRFHCTLLKCFYVSSNLACCALFGIWSTGILSAFSNHQSLLWVTLSSRFVWIPDDGCLMPLFLIFCGHETATIFHSWLISASSLFTILISIGKSVISSSSSCILLTWFALLSLWFYISCSYFQMLVRCVFMPNINLKRDYLPHVQCFVTKLAAGHLVKRVSLRWHSLETFLYASQTLHVFAFYIKW